MRGHKFFRIFILIFSTLSSCNSSSSSVASSYWQLIAGRDEGNTVSIHGGMDVRLAPPSTYERPFIYRVLVPTNWIRQDPSPTESIADTTRSICEFYILESDQVIRLTVHNFPIHGTHPRIPPQAQIARWKQQFDELDLLNTTVVAEGQGGFNGLRFEGQGVLHGQPTTVIGWSMQLASGYERQLSFEKEHLDRYKRADYTIKASGPPLLIDKHRADILAFAHHFELIDELPSPL